MDGIGFLILLGVICLGIVVFGTMYNLAREKERQRAAALAPPPVRRPGSGPYAISPTLPGWQPTPGQMLGAGVLGAVAGAAWEHHHQQHQDLRQAEEARSDATIAEVLYNQTYHQPDQHVTPHYHHGVYWEEHHH